MACGLRISDWLAQPLERAKNKKASKKDTKKVSKAIDDLNEGATGKKGKLSESAKIAFMGLLPTLIGGVIGGEEGLGIGARAGIKGVESLEASKAAAAKQDIEQQKIDVEREKFETKTRNDQLNRSLSLMKLKRLSDEDIRKRVVPGVGTALAEKDSQILKEKKTVLDNVTDGIDRLTALGAKNLASLSPEQRTAAQTEVQSLIGQLRIPLTGPGPLTDTEREFMESIIGNPTKIFSLSSNEQVKLDVIKSKFLSDFANETDLRTIEGKHKADILAEIKRRGI